MHRKKHRLSANKWHFSDNKRLLFRNKWHLLRQRKPRTGCVSTPYGLTTQRNRPYCALNDSYYDQLQEKFTLRQAMLLRDDDPDGNRTRSMIKNWTRQGLVRNIGVGEYEKV